jgi:hypothetical protein
MKIVEAVWLLIQFLIWFNLIFPVLLLLIYSLRGGEKRRPPHSAAAFPDYGIIVTAYEYTQQLPAVVASLLELNYERYHIYVVADKCDISGLHFPSDKVLLLRPEQVLGSNTRSHFHAIKNFIRPHSHLTIIDSDNLTDPQYLHELNTYFNQGFRRYKACGRPRTWIVPTLAWMLHAIFTIIFMTARSFSGLVRPQRWPVRVWRSVLRCIRNVSGIWMLPARDLTKFFRRASSAGSTALHSLKRQLFMMRKQPGPINLSNNVRAGSIPGSNILRWVSRSFSVELQV